MCEIQILYMLMHIIQSNSFFFFIFHSTLKTFLFSYSSVSFKIVTNSLWLISMSFSACEIKLLMLSSLLLAIIKILSCFFLFLIVPNNFFVIPVAKDKIKVKLAPAIPIGAPTTLADKIIQTPPLAAERTMNTLSM